VDESLFSISCTTCQARLKVHSEAVIGEILACPKCGSMVQVTPPSEWKRETAASGQAGEKTLPKSASKPPENIASSAAPAGAKAAAKVIPPPLPQTSVSTELASGTRGPDAAQVPGQTEAGKAAGLAAAVSPAEMLWQKWLFWLAAPAAAAVIAVGAWSIWPAGSGRQLTPQVAIAPEDAGSPAAPAREVGATDPSPSKLDRRWLPDRTQLLLSIRLGILAEAEVFGPARSLVEPAWESSLDRVVDAFGLRLQGIDRLTWASTDLSDWRDHAVVLIELAEGQDAGALRVLGKPMELELGGVACRRLNNSLWEHPFAILDRRTVVTGREELLRGLADRSGPGEMSPAVERFLAGSAQEGDLLMAVDLAATRQSGWRLPDWQMDVWPTGRDAWRSVWELPRGLGVAFRRGDRIYSELALICESETTASQVRDALAELIPAAKDSLASKAESLTDRLKAGQISATAADHYELVLEEGCAALDASHWEIVDETVWGRIEWGPRLAALAAALVEGRPAMRADWLAAARTGDEANQRRLLEGLGGYLKAEGRIPAGAGGGVLLPPETRLSWIATLLPYYDHRDWHRELDFGYSWNSPKNRPVARRLLGEVVNPALGPSTNEAGFPVTHYVGAAGVGADAGSLSAGDPRAGVFGFGRSAQPDDVPDGLSNTIAILGVVGRLGPWASGGDPTVRGITERPYVNGPDGFGSGQPDGMLVGMADGAVRFVSKDIDPEVFEQLVTAGGGEPVTVAVLDPPVTRGADSQPDAADSDSCPQSLSPPETQPATIPVAETRLAPPAEPVRPEPALPEVDLDAQLAGRVAGLHLPGVSLADAIRLVSQMAALPIALDLDNMAVLGVSLDDPITCRLPEATVGQMLEGILAERGLVYLVQNGLVLVTTPDGRRNELNPVRYPVSDLAGIAPDALEALAEMVRTLVAPDAWRTAGGRGTIEPGEGVIVVSQTEPVHRQLHTFLNELRLARGIPAASGHGGQPMGLASRLAVARVALERPVITTFHEPAPLEQVAEELAATSSTRIVVDWLALAAEGVPCTAAGSVKAPASVAAAAMSTQLL